MTTDTRLLEASLKKSARDLGLSVTFNHVNQGELSDRFNIKLLTLGASKDKYLSFNRGVVTIAGAATHFLDDSKSLKVGHDDFNPDQYIDMNAIDIDVIDNKVKAQVAKEMPNQTFFDYFETFEA